MTKGKWVWWWKIIILVTIFSFKIREKRLWNILVKCWQKVCQTSRMKLFLYKYRGNNKRNHYVIMIGLHQLLPSFVCLFRYSNKVKLHAKFPSLEFISSHFRFILLRFHRWFLQESKLLPVFIQLNWKFLKRSWSLILNVLRDHEGVGGTVFFTVLQLNIM